MATEWKRVLVRQASQQADPRLHLYAITLI
jgi:hypothetical protein